MIDLIITGARVYDGSGKESYLADAAVQGDRIVRVGNCGGMESAQRLDAAGLALLPGFIDTHTHSDALLFSRPERTEALYQGVTTELIGNCGIGLFPLDKAYDDYEPSMRGILGRIAPKTRFASAGAYLGALPRTGINVAAQTAHSPLRAEAVGFKDVPLTGKGMEKALALLRESFEEGAVSFTTGLSYFPATFGDTEELVALSRAAAAFDAPLCVHMRYVLRAPDPAFDLRMEPVEIARRSGVRIHYSHYRTNEKDAGKTDELLRPIEQAIAEGLSATADFYPYSVGSANSAVYLPLWAMDGGFDAVMARLRDPSTRAGIIKEMDRDYPAVAQDLITHAPGHPEYLGRSCADIAAKRGQTVSEMLAELLEQEELEVGYVRDPKYAARQEAQLEKDFARLLAKPYYMGGSDSILAQAWPHPRAHGAFAKHVRICRAQGIPLEVIANRLCRNPARLFQLKDRGEIAEGKYADICLFNPDKFRDRSDFTDPKRHAEGMAYVLINGKFALYNGTPTGTLAGRALYRGR